MTLESRYVAAVITTFYYDQGHYDFLMKRTQVQLAENVINLTGFVTETMTPAKVRKMRKADLAAVMAHYLTEYGGFLKGDAIVYPVKPLKKPEGQTGTLYPKQKRQRTPASRPGGQSRKSRRELTKNGHRQARGMKRLKLSQAAV